MTSQSLLSDVYPSDTESEPLRFLSSTATVVSPRVCHENQEDEMKRMPLSIDAVSLCWIRVGLQVLTDGSRNQAPFLY